MGPGLRERVPSDSSTLLVVANTFGGHISAAAMDTG